MTKRIGLKLKFCQFKQRLKYKCDSYHIGYKEVNEQYTSKMCSECGFLDEFLGGKKIYDCKGCNTVIDRDINGCRNIYFKGMF